MTDPSDWLLSSSGISIVFLIVAVWGWRSNWSVRARRALAACIILYTVAGLGIVPLTIGRFWAGNYGRFAGIESTGIPTAVVVLGAGSDTAHGWDTHLPLINSPSATRALEAARVFKLVDPQIVVTTGGEADRESKQTPSAILMSDELVRLGVPPSRIVVESRSLGTRDHAVLVGAILRERNIGRLILVTSDLHMRRAVGAFRATGWAPIAAAAPDVKGFHRARDIWVPGYGLGIARAVAHEVLGMAYYVLRGWWRW